MQLPRRRVGPELEGDLEHLAIEEERLDAEVEVAEAGLGRCLALVDLAVGILDEEAAALAGRLLVEVELLEPGEELVARIARVLLRGRLDDLLIQNWLRSGRVMSSRLS